MESGVRVSVRICGLVWAWQFEFGFWGCSVDWEFIASRWFLFSVAARDVQEQERKDPDKGVSISGETPT